MTTAGRVLLGALLGAWAVALIHPTSRAWVLGARLRPGPCPPLTPTWRPSDERLEAAERIRSRAADLRTLEARTPERLRSGLSSSQIRARREPANAYWLQMVAVFRQALGDSAGAREAWELAASCRRWADLQTDELLARADAAGRAQGIQQAWTLFAAYPLRSTDAVAAIKSFARVVHRQHPVRGSSNLRFRIATVANGRLLRDGSRSLLLAALGSDILEMATYPPSMASFPSQRALLIARYDLINAAREAGMEDEAVWLLRTFQENDGWNVLLASVDPIREAQTLAFGALLTAVLPGALALLSLSGLAVWGLGWLLIHRRGLRAPFCPPWVYGVGVAAGLLVYLQLRLWIPAVAVAAAFALLGFGPTRTRRVADPEMGPLFSFTVWLLASAFGLFHTLMIAGKSWPGWHLLPFLQLDAEFVGGAGAWASLAGLCLSGLLVVAPTWAMVERQSTPFVLGLALRLAGKYLALTGATLGLLSLLVALPLDRRLYNVGRELVENEPLHYYVQNP
ncbi:MAG: hypothetical protein N2109_03535 [Fimbriimonadales bacterium]|nr:hypothetical protein [Fimbriimonadales bacterium]